MIDCKNDGTVEGLHFDQFDLGFLGPKTVTRASEIVYNEATQLWDVVLPGQSKAFNAVTGFSGYDIARRFEVEWLQGCRKEGIPPISVPGEFIAIMIRSGGFSLYGPVPLQTLAS